MIELTETQEIFRREVERFARREIVPNATRWDRGDRFPMEVFKYLGELGWLGVGVDEALGGSGGGPVERSLLFEELARASAGVALGIYVHTVLAAEVLATVASTDLAYRYLPSMMSGRKTGAWAYAEPEAGADVTRVRLAARRDKDGYVLDGTKLYITNGTFADVILVVARTSGSPGEMNGLSVLVVDGESPGLRRLPMEKVGMHPSELGELHFDGCKVPATNLVGKDGSGFRDCLRVLSRGRIFAGALAVGLSRAALDAAVVHVTTREQFGGPLASLQGVRFTIADMAARLQAARALVYGAAASMARGCDFDTEASIAKLVATETATWMAERAMHLHGAQGFMLESPVQCFYRDCKILEYGEGVNELQREMISKAVFGGYRP